MNKEESIKMKKSSNKGVLIGSLLTLFAIGGYVFFTMPVAAEVSSLKDEVSVKENRVEDLRSRIAALEEAKEEYQLTTEVQRRESLRAVPVGMNQDDVIRDLMDIGERENVTLRSISFSRGSSGLDGIGLLRISAGFEGSYDELTDFLRSLETNTRIFRVSSINVQVRRLDFADLERAAFSLTIETFYQQ